jgi:predicted RNA-binding protein with PIN domain
VRYVVDGMNVIGTRPDGWWRDRPAARRRMVQALSVLAAHHDVTVVFDGRPEAEEVDEAAAAGVTARFAPGGPDAADAVIAAAVEADPAPGSLVVVTSDAALAGRVGALGAEVMASRRFRRLVDC